MLSGRKGLICAFALLGFAASAHSETPSASTDHVLLPADVVPVRYDITLVPNAEELTFTGEVKIAIRVEKTTDRIVLNAADLTIERARLSDRRDNPETLFDSTQQTATFVFPNPIEPGQYVLSITYAGQINQQISGLFALDYETSQGQRRALYTHLEAGNARRLVPSFDEPGRKAVFALTAIVPKETYAVSNMPVAEATSEAGRKTVRFADSPKMSSYLLFFAAGDFERISTKVGETDIGVVVRRGDGSKGEFALDAAAQLLTYYNEYFNLPYPLPKLDLVAAPAGEAGGMENWGSIFFADRYLLLDPKLSTEADKQSVFSIVAHEIAHQWFGDLVTMQWYEDLWLNEGFATWMENKATEHFHPEWKPWLSTAQDEQSAMDVDSRPGTHPVITPINDVFQAASAFDLITYYKGMAVVRMLEAFMGEDAFREGVRAYIKKHAYGNAVSSALWAEMDEVSPLPVSEIAHDFTVQAGVPLIHAESAPDGVKLSQQRLVVQETPDIGDSWHTPVILERGGTAWRGIVSAAEPAIAPSASSDAAVVNAGQTAYLRVAYDSTLWTTLMQQLALVKPGDQLGLLYDSLALGEAGFIPMQNFLELSARIADDAEPLLLNTLATKFATIDSYYEGLPGRAPYRAYARGRLKPIAERLGWDVKSGEPDNDAVLRSTALEKLGIFDDAATIAEARRRFAAYRANPEALSGSVRKTVLNIVAASADEATWNELHELAKAAVDATDKTRLYALLGSSYDVTLSDRALALALGDEAPVTTRIAIISAVRDVFPDHAFDFVMQNRAAVEALLEPRYRYIYFARIGAKGRELATAEKLMAYAEANVPPSARGDFIKAISEVRYRTKVIAERVPDIDRWLAFRHAGP